MDIHLDHLNFNELWTKPIEQYHISPEIEETIKTMALQTINENYVTISNITIKIVNSEYIKHSAYDLHKRLLIKNQIVYNITENIKKLAINMAKEKYDMELARHYDENLVPINFDTEFDNRLFFGYDINNNTDYNNTDYNNTDYNLECNEEIDLDIIT